MANTSTCNLDTLVDILVKDAAACKDRIHVVQKAMGVILFHYPGGRGLSPDTIDTLAEDLAESACLKLNIPC